MTSDFNSQSINTSEMQLVQLHRKSLWIDALVMCQQHSKTVLCCRLRLEKTWKRDRGKYRIQ